MKVFRFIMWSLFAVFVTEMFAKGHLLFAIVMIALLSGEMMDDAIRLRRFLKKFYRKMVELNKLGTDIGKNSAGPIGYGRRGK